MAKRLTNTGKFEDVSDAETVVAGESEDISELDTDLDGQIDAITQEFGGDPRDEVYKMTVHQVLKDKGKYAWLFSCVPTELPILDRLRDEYGGGEFEVRVFKNGRLNRRFFQTIIPPKKPVVLPTPPDNTMVIMQGFEKLGELIAKQQTAPVPTQNFNPMTMMGSMMGMMVQMKEFVSPTMNALPAPGYDMLVKGIELAKDLNTDKGESSTTDIFMKLIDVFGKPIAEMAGKMDEQSVTPQPRSLTPPVSVSSPQFSQGNETMNFLSLQLRFLIAQAKRGADPALYADLIIDQVPEDKLRAFILASDALDKLTALNSEVSQFLPWFELLGVHIREALTEFPDPVHTNGDAPDDPDEPHAAESPLTSSDEPT